MTHKQARLIILVLAMKRIPFKLRLDGNTYVVQFAAASAPDVATAVGA